MFLYLHAGEHCDHCQFSDDLKIVSQELELIRRTFASPPKIEMHSYNVHKNKLFLSNKEQMLREINNNEAGKP